MNINDFAKIMNYIYNEGIKVKRVSDLDTENGITQNKVTMINEIPEQIILNVTVK